MVSSVLRVNVCLGSVHLAITSVTLCAWSLRSKPCQSAFSSPGEMTQAHKDFPGPTLPERSSEPPRHGWGLPACLGCLSAKSMSAPSPPPMAVFWGKPNASRSGRRAASGRLRGLSGAPAPTGFVFHLSALSQKPGLVLNVAAPPCLAALVFDPGRRGGAQGLFPLLATCNGGASGSQGQASAP